MQESLMLRTGVTASTWIISAMPLQDKLVISPIVMISSCSMYGSLLKYVKGVAPAVKGPRIVKGTPLFAEISHEAKGVTAMLIGIPELVLPREFPVIVRLEY